MPQHPAHLIPFDILAAELEDAVVDGLVSIKTSANYKLYCYTQRTVYDRLWTPATTVARGLILDHANKRIAATPFPKFWSHSERPDDPIPDLPFEVFEKLDGSLIIIWHDADDGWVAATKGSFTSNQAAWANHYLTTIDTAPLIKGHTYLAEFVGPSNRIVVQYPKDELILLSAYDEHGHEYDYIAIEVTAANMTWRAVQRHSFNHISEILTHADTLTHDEEGFVLRFANGYRLKIKGAEYRRIHALISGCTPLGLWRALEAGDDMQRLRQQLPEEFWSDYDAIVRILQDQLLTLVMQVVAAADAVQDKSDKEVGLQLATYQDPVRTFLFPYRKNKDLLGQPRLRRAVFRHIRPTRNTLPGYTPSYAMHRVQEEES